MSPMELRAMATRALVNMTEAGATRLFQSTVARPAFGQESGWLLMNRQAKGYGEGARPFGSLHEIRQAFACRLGTYGEDEHGEFWEIIAEPPARAAGSGYTPHY